MGDALDAIEEAFRSVADGKAINVPRHRGALSGITINTMGAISTALDATGVKCYPVVRQDITVGSSFTMLVYRISSGELIGILEANALSQIRTGAASGVATKYLAREDSRVMTIFGAGWQARTQLEAIARVLPKLERVNVIGRSAARVHEFCEVMKQQVDVELIGGGDPEAAVRKADIVTTITGAREPVFDGRWLKPGVHINAAGSNYATKRELDATAVRRSDRIVVDDLTLAQIESGDLLHVDAQPHVDWSRVHTLADVVAGKVPRRKSAEEITLFESHGLALEDLAVACKVLDRARERGTGMDLPIR
jgi:ornithine cyclodeaminase/alanine dehydrogenase-like protein (mu-crystallin family)